MSKQTQEAKDGLIQQRAMKALGITEVYTQKTLHLRSGDGACLCGFTGTGVSEWSVDTKKLVECKRCQNKAAALIEAQAKQELRDYWRRPEHGGLKPKLAPAKKAPASAHEPLPLDPELLPTGTGKGGGITLTWRGKD